MKIAFYGSSLLSSYWNGAATYYRGLIRALAEQGCETVFFEPDAHGRQQNRDMDPPDWCDVRVYDATPRATEEAVACAGAADIVVTASGVGVFDDILLQRTMDAAAPHALRIWWDVDAPATLAEITASPEAPLRRCLPHLDAVLTYGGGESVVKDYLALGARRCEPVYNALDPASHFPVPPDPRFRADLAFLGNRLPDREARVRAFFSEPARRAPDRRFLLGGSGWEAGDLPGNVSVLGHVASRDHNAFNVTPLAVLNINRDSMAQRGFSPATRIFEAAGAGACLISDEWPGMEMFLQPGWEVLIARDGEDVLGLLEWLTPERARAIGEAARARILAEHTYDRRARQVLGLFEQLRAQRCEAVPA